MASCPKRPDTLILWWRPHHLRTASLQGIKFGEKHAVLWGKHCRHSLPPSDEFFKTALEKSVEFAKGIQGYESAGIIASKKGRKKGRKGGSEERKRKGKHTSNPNIQQTVSKQPLWVDAKTEKEDLKKMYNKICKMDWRGGAKEAHVSRSFHLDVFSIVFIWRSQT